MLCAAPVAGIIAAMNAIQGARSRARAEITAAIKEEARRQLADEGAARLSLRAVARQLGMASSAIYRYFPSRDDLLTALIVDAYDAVGAAAEQALGSAGEHPDPVARWCEVCRAVRGWARDHPHEYALIYGSPVPGYAAPRDTAAPAARIGRALLIVAADARSAGLFTPPGPGRVPAAVADDLRQLAGRMAGDAPQAPSVPAELLTAPLIAAWAQLFGLISFELFGHFNRVIEAREEFFTASVTRLAHDVGLRSPGA